MGAGKPVGARLVVRSVHETEWKDPWPTSQSVPLPLPEGLRRTLPLSLSLRLVSRRRFCNDRDVRPVASAAGVVRVSSAVALRFSQHTLTLVSLMGTGHLCTRSKAAKKLKNPENRRGRRGWIQRRAARAAFLSANQPSQLYLWAQGGRRTSLMRRGTPVFTSVGVTLLWLDRRLQQQLESKASKV